MNSPAAQHPERRFPLILGLPLSLVAGVAMPIQGRANGALGAALGDGLLASVVSFGSGLLLIAVLAVLLPSGRRGVRQIPTAVRTQAFPWWYMLAGAFGAYFVFTQSIAAAVLGIALFTVANVLGQTLSGMVVDATGFGPGGPRPITGLRVIGALLTVGAVIWAVSPHLGGGSAPLGELLLPLLLPFTAGLLNGFQTAMNGTQTRYYGTFVPATLFNFLAGLLVLGIALLVKIVVAGPAPHAFPSGWYYYVGGSMGVVFIGVAAFLSRHIGVLLTSLGMIAGQLIGSLVLDAVIPSDGGGVALATVLGTIAAILAVSLASIQPGTTMPWERGRRSFGSGRP